MYLKLKTPFPDVRDDGDVSMPNNIEWWSANNTAANQSTRLACEPATKRQLR